MTVRRMIDAGRDYPVRLMQGRWMRPVSRLEKVRCLGLHVAVADHTVFPCQFLFIGFKWAILEERWRHAYLPGIIYILRISVTRPWS